MYAEHTEKTRSLGSRTADVFQAITSDEDAHVLIYVQEALRGHAILNVYAPTDEQAERVKDILVAHHARTIKYFGRWAIACNFCASCVSYPMDCTVSTFGL